ncbi:uncharacterized protein N7515_005605 [Penicillium bovifimosum]|uniref:Uncharacterized protein n=1 Tax=Penicillium bovifimosum TaxID=126998 RepID=A0A9W9GUE8_9EURO|nr:uncharacterized protein N7515_005605 [Penicillium bovifimosum]KAJ5129566.1 hypothetical protein N7515_005605 [Penicillium bovifimosum]
MERKAMPLPRVPGLSLPSFREVEEAIFSHRRGEESFAIPRGNNSTDEERVPSCRELEESVFSHRRGGESFATTFGIDGTYERPGESATSISPSPGHNNTSENPFPPYPVRGWNIPPDPSQNAFWESGFARRHPNLPRVLYSQPSQTQAVNRGRFPTRNLPIRERLSEISSTTIQWSVSPAPTPSSSQLSPSSEPWSPETRPIHPPRPPLADRNPNEPLRSRPRDQPEPSPVSYPRTQRRRIGVAFQDVAAHTAKCDVCNKRNKNGMSRCQNCGWQICRKCVSDRGADRTHASFGATHVPERNEDTGQVSPAVEHGEEVRAAQSLLDLGAYGNRDPSAVESPENSRRDGPSPVAVRGSQLGDALSTDSELTLYAGEWPDEEDDVPIGEDGLPLGYVITRRNPSRAARPSKMAE